MLKQILIGHGLDPNRDVVYIHQSGGTQLAALLSGSVDATILGVQPRYIGVNAGMSFRKRGEELLGDTGDVRSFY